jgi:hypothetical protein
MAKRDRAIAIAKKALDELKLEIDRHAKGAGTVGDTGQLLHCQRFIEEILHQMESNQVPTKGMRDSGMGHMIVDSWPLSTQLGSLLCAAEQAYLEI